MTTVPARARSLKRDKPVPARPPQERRAHPAPRVCAVRFAITGNAPTPRHAAVALGDVLRQSCMSNFGRANNGAVSQVLSGKLPDGARLRGRHEHAHYLAFSSGGDNSRLLDSMVVWAPAGLDPDELAAIAVPHRLFAGPHVQGVNGRRLGVEAWGTIGDVAPELIGASTVWGTATPFAPTRYGRGSFESLVIDNVTRELANRDLPAPCEVRIVTGDWIAFRRYRLREVLDDARRAFGVEIEFDQPVEGPIVLGQLSHFGLGIFRPVTT